MYFTSSFFFLFKLKSKAIKANAINERLFPNFEIVTRIQECIHLPSVVVHMLLVFSRILCLRSCKEVIFLENLMTLQLLLAMLAAILGRY